ncbi:MAG TPA: TonB-dependent receptor [Acidobacteriaceae bacterium]
MQTNRRFARVAAMLAIVLLCLTGLGRAQEFRGTISGAVTDPSGAVIPNAQVVVKEIHTGTTNKTKSDATGQYVVPFLLPGDYTITATAQGFETLTHSGITLEAQAHPIVDLHLKVGNTGETVEVTTNAPLLDQTNASVGQVISTESVADLPVNGRTPTTLTELSVGVITTAAPQLVHPFDNNAGNSWSMAGTPNQVSEVLLDGSPDLTLLGALAYAPTQDSVSEVSVRPFDTDASFGHTIGGVINQVTKSGTNRLHGSIYEFSQLSALDANTYFNDRAGIALPVTHYNQYGLTAGGPIWIPHLFNGKDKLFWFFAFEGLKDSQPTTTTTTVPTNSGGLTGSGERAGDFYQTLVAGCPAGFANDPSTAAAMCNPSGSNKTAYLDPNQLYDPFPPFSTVSGTNISRNPILDNQLQSLLQTSADPVAAKYLALFPAPNNTAGETASGQDNYISNAPSADTYNNEFGRLDYNLSSRDHVFFDFRHNNRTQTKNDYFGNGITGTTLLRENFGGTLDNVFSLNSTTILDTRFNYTRFNEVHGTPGQKYSPTDLGFPSYVADNSLLQQLPYINFGTGGSCGSFTSYQCLGDTGSALDPTTSYQFFADVVKIVGRHTLKIGFDGRQYRLSVQNFGASAGTYTFNSSWINSGTSGGNSNIFGGDLAAFMLGLASSGSYAIAERADYHNYYTGTFVQDDWRVNDKLTLNLGLRFDIDTPFREKLGRTVNGFDPGATNSASAAAAAAFKPQTVTSNGVTATVNSINTLGGLTFPSGNNGAVYETNNGFLSPRIGFSYSPRPKDVIRGGFGIFVQPETLSNLAATGTYSSNAISNNQGFSASTTYTATTNNYQSPAATLSNPYPSGSFVQPTGSSLGASTFLGQAISFLAPKEHDPYAERWDLGVQHSITNSTMLELLYVGNHSLHLPVAAQNLNATLLPYLTTNPYRNQALSAAYGKTVTNPYYGLLPNGGSANSKTVAFNNLVVPYPQYGTAAVTIQNQTIGQSYFQEGIIHLEQRARHGLTLTANYSFSKLIEADTFLNDEDTMVNRRISPFDHTHHFTTGATYELPFGRNKMFSFGGSRLMDEIAGGWVINGVYQFQTGAPIEFSADIPLQPGVTLRQLTNQTRNTSPVPPSGVNGNPAIPLGLFVAGVSANSTTCPSSGPCDGSTFINGQYFDHYRTLPQTMSWVRSDGYNNLDASILKNFNFTESAYLQLRFETFNTLNHPVFAAPNISSATASNFGYITSVIANSLPRQVQLGARIVF